MLRQIDGFGIQPVCSNTETAQFPPRQEPFDFRLQLEAKYRDGLQRAPGETYVDVEGDICMSFTSRAGVGWRAGASASPSSVDQLDRCRLTR